MYLAFLTTSVLYLVVTLAFRKRIGQVLAWKSGHKCLYCLSSPPEQVFKIIR
jgi:hypothetical protein